MTNVLAYPNPSINTLNVCLKETNEKAVKNYLKDIKQIMISDKFGNVRKINKYSGKTKCVTLDISYLPVDMYIMEVSDGNQKTVLKISVKK